MPGVLAITAVVVAVVVIVTVAQPVSLHVRAGPGTWSVTIRFLAWRLRLPSTRAREPERRATRKKRSDAKRSKGARAMLPYRRAAPGLLRAALAGVRHLGRAVHVDRLRLAGRIATEDPATTGMIWGSLQAVLAGIPLPNAAEIALAPVFDGGSTRIEIDAAFSARAARLLATPLVVAWHLPLVELWRAWRTTRRDRSPKKEQGDPS